MLVARQLGFAEFPATYEGHVSALYRGEITEEELWAKLAGRELNDAEIEFCERCFIEHFPPIRPMLDFARELRELGIGTALLSNTQNLHVRAFQRMGEFADFFPTFYSWKSGCASRTKRCIATSSRRSIFQPSRSSSLTISKRTSKGPDSSACRQFITRATRTRPAMNLASLDGERDHLDLRTQQANPKRVVKMTPVTPALWCSLATTLRARHR